MRRYFYKPTLVFCLILIYRVVIPAISFAQNKSTFTHEQHDKLIKLRAAVKANMASLDAHRRLIRAWGVDSALILQYKIWMKQYPNLATIPFAIGKGLEEGEMPEAKAFLLKAVQLDPKLAEAWNLLAQDANMTGDKIAACVYSDKAIELDSLNVDYAFYNASYYEKIYTSSYQSHASELSKRLLGSEQTIPAIGLADDRQSEYHLRVVKLIKRFPDSERSIQALYWVAERERDADKKVAVYELMRDKYASSKSRWYRYSMEEYYKLVFVSDPQKALEIAQKQKIVGRVKLAEKIIGVKQLLKDKKLREADSLAQSIKLPNIDADETLLLFKAQVTDSAHHTRAAYDTILNYYVKMPDDTIQKALYQYGCELGLNPKLVQNNVKILRDSLSIKAANFSLYNYLTNEKTTLSDFKGKVILLTYWFPGCGPCRNEMPYFEEALKKFDKKDVVYLGINAITDQDPLVIPFLKQTGYSFIPLRDPLSGKGTTLEAVGYPTNFLIDQDSRIVFSNFRIDAHNDDMLEVMISDLLNAYQKQDVLADSIKTN